MMVLLRDDAQKCIAVSLGAAAAGQAGAPGCQHRLAVGGRAHDGAGHGLFQPFPPPAAVEKAGVGLGSIARLVAATELCMWDTDGRAAVRSSCRS